ncbi:hypothetical protein CKM354_000930700 [Cercospora kikuchii]|uniref:Uncharacterized protein n=1 Tax=Cercospora kikuchii TaxID=84275 RepID=A0A9P3FJY0_9PEZI|nr:uncharacterized protein CKM354_000930700 [Cercospora kikuchii]GIZ46169.1 hypothetical protein CKM354_000930700 [Cercospora kikuchii]
MTSTLSTTDLRQRIEQTARSFLFRFEETSTKNDASIINLDVTEDCTRHMLPASVNQTFQLPADFFFDNKTYQGAVANDIKVLKFKNNVLSNLVIDTEARLAAFTSIAEIHPVDGTEWYSAEQAWYLCFNDDGSKVTKVVEFCDKDVLVKMASASK